MIEIPKMPDPKALMMKAKAAAKAQMLMRQSPAPDYAVLPELTGDHEADSKADLGAVENGFRKRAADEGARKRLATDSEYWACICFQTREQKEAFLTALRLIEFGDKYLDGQVVAERLGVELPAADVPYNTSSKIDPKWVELTE